MEEQHPKDADLPQSLGESLHAIATTGVLLVALDFDGTLSMEVDDPAEARAIPAATAAVLRLLDVPDTRVALISGRAAQSLLEVSQLPDTVLIVGSHGAETRLDGPDIHLDLDDTERGRVQELSTVLAEIAEPLEDVWVESKPAGFALHTRLATEANTRFASEQALQRTGQISGLTVRRGKNVLEFSVRSTTKGEAIALLREHTGATAVFFAGDDVTDEDGFAALVDGDLGLKIGSGETRAQARVHDPNAVAATLDRLADLRIKHTSTPNSSIGQ